jgi:hypothetical protein
MHRGLPGQADLGRTRHFTGAPLRIPVTIRGRYPAVIIPPPGR